MENLNKLKKFILKLLESWNKMKLDKFGELSRGKKTLVIIGINILMIVIYTSLLVNNAASIFSGASYELTIQSGINVFFNASIIFVKLVVFLISYIVMNIMLIKNRLKAAIIFFIVVILLTLVISGMQVSEYNKITEEVSEFAI